MPDQTLMGFIDIHARERDITGKRERYLGVTVVPSHAVVDRLPPGFEERRSCCRFPDLVVWSSDEELAVVSWELLDSGDRAAAGHLVMEVWLTKDGYHERLDELAGVAA